MAKKKTAGSGTTPTPSVPPAAPVKRRAAPRAKASGVVEDAAPAQAAGAVVENAVGSVAENPGQSAGKNPVESRPSAPDMGAAPVNGAPSESAAPYAPTFEQIAEEAYHRYLRRGGDHGADFEDWIEAERRLRERQK